MIPSISNFLDCLKLVNGDILLETTRQRSPLAIPALHQNTQPQ
jgi:hypothetical protein